MTVSRCTSRAESWRTLALMSRHSGSCTPLSSTVTARIRQWISIRRSIRFARPPNSSRYARRASRVSNVLCGLGRNSHLRITLARELIRMSDTLTQPYAATEAKPPSKRIQVAVLGATGSVGQRFVQLLNGHPWFKLHEVVASERSAGKSYGEAADWRLDTLMPSDAAALPVKNLGADLESRLVFSGLDSSVAGEAEDDYANRGCLVVSNSRNHRMDPEVPLLIPEINADHIASIERQRK